MDFLIGNMVISLVFANLMFLKFARRVIYVLASFPIAVCANIVRTTFAVVITEVSEGRINLAMDHALFGWFVFFLAILTQMFVGLRFRDSGERAGRAIGIDRILRYSNNDPPKPFAAAVIATAIAIFSPAAYATFKQTVPEAHNMSICLPVALRNISSGVPEN